MPTEAIPSITATAARRGERGGGRSHRGRYGTLLGLVCLACLWSLASGVASLVAWQAGRVSADAPALVAAGAQERAIRRLLASARRLDPGNPRYADQFALHLERLAGQTPPRSDLERGLLTQARDLYLEGVRQRPTWPLGLTSVLRTDFKLQRWGQEFTRRYARAADLGRSEPVALRALVDLGLAVWPVLDPDGRREVATLLRHGLRLDPAHLMGRAVQLRRAALVEPLIADDPALVRRFADLRARAAGLR